MDEGRDIEVGRTDPRILTLLIAIGDYIRAREETVNPFVKGFGETQNSDEAYKFMVESFTDCEDYYPEVEEFYNKILEANNQEIVNLDS
jgi:hypothetical protein